MISKRTICIAMAGIILFASGCGSSQSVTTASLSKIGVSETDIISSDKENIEDTTYILETNYNGADVPIELYDVPFQKTDYYVSNKEFSDMLGKKTDGAESYIDTATACTEVLFGNNYTDILNDQDSFTNALETYFASDEYMFDIETDDMISSLLEAYVDGKLEVTATFTTDDSLIYNDILYYLRGVVEVTVRNGNAKDYENILGIKTAMNQTVKLMVEYSFEPNNAENIVGIEILGYIQ